MRIVCIISLLLLFGCGGIITNTINPPVSEIDEMTRQILQMHQTIISVQQVSSPEAEGSFLLTWKPNPLSEDVDGYNVYRSTGLDSQFILLFSASATDTQYQDTSTSERIRYRYALTAYRDTLESGFSNILSGAWVSVGSPTTSKDMTYYRDSLWTTDDLLIVLHPTYHPCSIEWIRNVGGESVKWIGFYDVDHNRVVDLSDLVYYSGNYNKTAWDSLGISR